MTRVKICGLRSVENALLVARAGADMLGLNFYPKTPRYVEPAQARQIARRLRTELGADCPLLVGVFVNAAGDEVRAVADEVGLDFVQLSGDEKPAAAAALEGLAFKSIRPPDKAAALRAVRDFEPAFPPAAAAPSLLLDAFNPTLYGGTGETASLAVARAVRAAVPRLMLAGGLTPQNVAERVAAVRPWGVDAASGVEGDVPGIKAADKVRAFIAAVRAADGAVAE